MRGQGREVKCRGVGRRGGGGAGGGGSMNEDKDIDEERSTNSPLWSGRGRG